MSVAGFDLGDQASCVAVARKRGIDVLLNKESKRECPSVVAFGAKQRQLGTDAVGSLAINPKNTVTQLKRLLGKTFSSRDVQRDIEKLPFIVRQGPEDTLLVDVQYLNETATLSPEQLVAMLMVDLKSIAEADKSPVTDCVIGIPTFFTEAERRAMLGAAQIAGVNCLRLLNENTATALAFGIYKQDLPEKDPVNVAFVDLGHAALQVTIVAFKKGQLRVLSHNWDRNLGGRDFDEVLFDHFCEEFAAKHNINVKANARASFRLRQACEKMKKVLSANAQASLSVESIMDDVDVRGTMTRDLFEEMSASVLQRVRQPLQQALADAKLQPDQLASVEIVGGSSRVPAVLAILKETLQAEPSRTLNAKECISRGCALNCAMLSPIFRVRDFEVIDSFPYGISLSWDKDGEPVSSVLFEQNGPIPSTKVLTFKRSAPFSLTASYTSDSPLPASLDRHIATFTVGSPKPTVTGEPAKLKVRLRLNLHGVVSIESVQQIEEEEYEEIVKKAAVPQPAKAQAQPKAAEPKDEPMAEPDGAAPPANGQATSAPAPDEAMEDRETLKTDGTQPIPTDNGAGPMETEQPSAVAQEPQTEVVKKRRTLKHAVDVQAQHIGPSARQLAESYESECQMALQGRIQEQTNETKNALEAFIYATRSKLSDPWYSYATEAERTNLSQKLEKMEDWLYDEGEDETKAVYNSQLESLTKQAEPIAARAREAELRGPAATALTNTASYYLQLVSDNKPEHSHIPDADKNKVLQESQAALAWLEDKRKVQESLAKTDDPLLTAADINKKNETLSRVCHPLMSKPAPKPEPKKEVKKEEPAAEKMETDPPAAEPAPAGEQAFEGAGAQQQEGDDVMRE